MKPKLSRKTKQNNASTTKNFESKKEVSAIIIITTIIHE
jgi:hypothetical protein